MLQADLVGQALNFKKDSCKGCSEAIDVSSNLNELETAQKRKDGRIMQLKFSSNLPNKIQQPQSV